MWRPPLRSLVISGLEHGARSVLALGLSGKLALITGKFLVFFRDLAGLLRIQRIPAFFKHEIKHLAAGVMRLIMDVQDIVEQILVTCFPHEDVVTIC